MSGRGRSAGSDALLLAATFLGELVVGVPLFTLVMAQVQPDLATPVLVGVALVGVSYTLMVLLMRRLVVGSIVALIVFSTFKANVPVFAIADRFPKDVVGELFLFHVPIAVLAILLVVRRWYRHAGVTGLLLSAFVVATTAPWLTGTAESPTAAAFFTLFVAVALVAYLSIAGAVGEGLLRFETVVQVLLLTVGTHAAVAIVQFLNQDPLGFTTLGEGGPLKRVAVDVPLLGEMTIGPFVSGFTGMSFVLASLVVLVLPAAVALAARRRGVARAGLGVSIVVLVGVLRASASDGARGALLVAVAGLVVLVLFHHRSGVAAWGRRVLSGQARTIGWTAGALVLGAASALAFVHPSEATGGAPREAPNAGSEPIDVSEYLTDVTLPFLNLANLDIRLQQYVAGIDLFLEHPLFGIGGMNWVLVAGQYGFTVPGGRRAHLPIHSVYVTLLATTGIVGFLLYVGALLGVLVAGLRLLARANGSAILVAGVLAGFVGILAYSAIGVLHLYSAAGLLPLWIVAGAIVGERQRVVRQDEATAGAS